MKLKEIRDFLNNWAPEAIQEDWDNSGYQFARIDKDIKNILLSLDYNREVFELAKEKNIDLVITHHPFFFDGIKSITDLDYKGQLIIDTIKADLALYSSHTSLDMAKGGVNDKLGEIFNLKRTKRLTEDLDGNGYGIVGEIKETLFYDFLREVKLITKAPSVRYLGYEGEKVKKIALVGGSGASFLEDVCEAGADVFITGDFKYHDFQRADELNIKIIDIGHFYSERIILEEIKNKLEEFNRVLNIEIYDKPVANIKTIV